MLRFHALSVSFCLAFVMSACGSDDGEESGVEGSGANGSGAGSNTPIDVGSGGSSGSGSVGGKQDGGTVPLTDEQIEAIENGACAGWSTEGELLPAVLQLVVDVSGSMERDAPGSSDSKWQITRDALSSALSELPASTSVGVLYYPNTGDSRVDDSDEPRAITECIYVEPMVPIASLGADGSEHRDRMEQSLDDADTGGGTPTHDAYKYALENGLQPYQTSASKFMLLITDGQPTYALECVGDGSTHADNMIDEEPIVQEIAAAFADGIRTFVIGSPGSEEGLVTEWDDGEGRDVVIETFDERPWLSRAAMEGGTAVDDCEEDGPNFCHFDMTEAENFGQALTDGLKQIAGQLNRCTYVIPAPPEGQTIDLAAVNLIVHDGSGAELVLPDNTGDCSEGWTLNDEDQVELCEETCQRVKEDTQARVELLFGCASGEVPVR